MAQDDDIIEIKADGKFINSFPYKQRKKYKHLFKLAGIELINITTHEPINKHVVYNDSLDEEE